MNTSSSKPKRGGYGGLPYPVWIAIAISAFRILDRIYPDLIYVASHYEMPWLQWFTVHFPVFVSTGDRLFIINFVEWFGVIYGLMVPLVLVRAWEQFDAIDREFDKEADAIKILSEDVMLLSRNKNDIKKDVLNKLIKYIDHVIANYTKEHEDIKLQNAGNLILKKIRKTYSNLFRLQGPNNKEDDSLLLELLHQLNEIIDARGDRIASSSQRLFETLHAVSLIASIIFIVPFYFIDLNVGSAIPAGYEFGIFGYVLIGSVTYLVIFLLTLIEDLDEPFGGKWRVLVDSWNELSGDIKDDLEEIDD